MNTPNPLIPQGSLLEQKAKGKPHLRVAYIIVAVHLVFLGGLLIQGCKRDDTTSSRGGQSTNDTTLPPLGQADLTNLTAQAATNTTTPDLGLPPLGTPATPAVTQTPPPPATDLTPTAATRDYVVLHGDNFTTIGKKFGVTATAIAKANPGVDSTRLKVGQKLVIPAASSTTLMATAATTGGGTDNVYVVKSGDTLSRIASSHGTTVSEIKAANGLRTDRIKVGDKLKLPAAKAAPAAAPTAATNPVSPTTPPPGGTGNI